MWMGTQWRFKLFRKQLIKPISHHSRHTEMPVYTHLQDLGQEGGGELGGVLDNHVVTLVLVGHVEPVQQGLGGLAHDHGAEQLATQPGSTTRGNAGLDDGNLQ